MLDIQELRKDLASVIIRLKARGFDFPEKFSELEAERKAIQILTEALQAKRNATSKQIGILMGQIARLNATEEFDQADFNKHQAEQFKHEVNNINVELDASEVQLNDVQSRMKALLLNLPNLPHDSVPAGQSEADNEEVRKVGTPRDFKKEGFSPSDHTDVGTPLGLDFDMGAKLSGARFTFMRGKVAKLHRALSQFMLDTQEKHGYEECYTPYLVNAQTLYGTGQLPKFEEDLFRLKSEAISFPEGWDTFKGLAKNLGENDDFDKGLDWLME